MLICDFRDIVRRSEEEERLPNRYVRETMRRLGLEAAGSIFKVLLMYSQIDQEEFWQYGFFAVPIE